MDDRATTIDGLKGSIRQFTSERGWNPDARSLAISISIEAAELLEHFQWNRYVKKDDHEAIENELADVLIYSLQFAMTLKIDVSEAVTRKLAVSARKYPAELFTPDQDGARNYFAAKEAARRAEEGQIEATEAES
jgi:NTP pyrophosphatase (non-canonical NTP hydrolase)